MPPKKKGKGRKKEQPPLTVQGLLHLEASFVAPADGGNTLATVTPGACYGYGDGAGHVPEEEEGVAPPQPGPQGDSPVAAAYPVAPLPDAAVVSVPINGQPPLPPQQHQGYQEYPAAHGDGMSNGYSDATSEVSVIAQYPAVPPRLAPQAGLATQPAPATTQASTPAASTTGQAVIRAAPVRNLPPPPPPPPPQAQAFHVPPPSSMDAPPPLPPGPPPAEAGDGAGLDAASAVATGQMSTRQLVAAAAAAADPSGHWCSGAQHPQTAAAPAAHATCDSAPLPISATADTAANVTAVAPPPVDPLSEAAAAGDGLLQHYWQFVRENQYDFNGWTYLLQHVEKQPNLDAIRAVYNAFLPLYPYCYAYWKKYADLEQRSGYGERSRQILERAVRAIPLSVELWMSLLNLFREMVQGQKDAHEQTRELCERAVRSAGSQFRADALWECFIQWETTHGTLRGVTAIYRRLLKIPTRLYNRHWDNFLQHVRDYHPRDILEYDEYLALRRQCCVELGMAYKEEPAFDLPEPEKNPKPEMKLITAIKEKLVADMVPVHEETQRKTEKRWKLEDKIKRPYFHVIALDKRQLRAWRDYLELEAADGDHQSLVLLYERCLIACAQYEEFWMQYARYLERRLPATADAGAGKGGKDEGASFAGAADDASVQRLITADQSGRTAAAPFETESQRLPEERSDVGAGFTAQQDPADAVREVYKRACLVHCPSKPNVRMQWAAFEESVEFGRRQAWSVGVR